MLKKLLVVLMLLALLPAAGGGCACAGKPVRGCAAARRRSGNSGMCTARTPGMRKTGRCSRDAQDVLTVIAVELGVAAIASFCSAAAKPR